MQSLQNRLLTGLLFVLALALVPAAKGRAEEPAEVIAIGDVHGAFEPLRMLLQSLSLIDDEDRWIGGRTRLVSVGDLIDRGDATQSVLDLFMRLESEAAAAGGSVQVVLGNHEVMNLLGDWRYVSKGDLRSFSDGDDTEALAARQAAFAPGGRYGAWLLKRPMLLKVGDTLFAHGGLSTAMPRSSIDAINEAAKVKLQWAVEQMLALRHSGVLGPEESATRLKAPEDGSDEDPARLKLRETLDGPLFGSIGPLWYRGSSRCPAPYEVDVLTPLLRHFGARRLVVGHTPVWDHRISARLGGALWRIDTGMLKSAYGGEPTALRIRGASVEALNRHGQPVDVDRGAAFALGNAGAVKEKAEALQALAIKKTGDETEFMGQSAPRVEITGADRSTGDAGVFRKLGKKAVARELAAWRLDRYLGLGLVPDTFAARLNNQSGVVVAVGSSLLTEARQAEKQRVYSNYCERGSGYALVAVFDALIGQNRRSAANLAYDRGVTRIRLLDHGNAFGTATQLPGVNVPRVLAPSLKARLEALSQETLMPLVGELISKRELRAMLKRRDALIAEASVDSP